MRIPENPTASPSVEASDAQTEMEFSVDAANAQSADDCSTTGAVAVHAPEITAYMDAEKNTNANGVRIVRRPRRFGSFH